MNRVDFLKEEKNSNCVKFKEFMRITTDKVIPIFFEGDNDQKYYSSRIDDEFYNIKWAGIACKGKFKLLELRENIRSHFEYKDSRCIFFIDADFDDNYEYKGEEDIYITPCHSIENFYIYDVVFEKIIKDEFKISKYSDESECFDNLMNNFLICKKDYLEKITEFNYFIKMNMTNKNQLNLKDIKLKDIIKVNLEQCNLIYKNIKDLFPKAENISNNYNSAIIFFREKDKELWFRGKQHLEFIFEYIKLLIHDRNEKEVSKRKIFKYRKRIPNISEENILSLFSRYAYTPECLIFFLEKFKKSLKNIV